MSHVFRLGGVAYSQHLFWRYIGDNERTMAGIPERWEGQEIRLKVRRASKTRQCLDCDSIIHENEMYAHGRKSVSGEKIGVYYCLNCVKPPKLKVGPLRTMLPPITPRMES